MALVKCENCLYWSTLDEIKSRGVCCRHAPVVLSNGSSQPVTGNADQCGDGEDFNKKVSDIILMEKQ